MARVTEKEAETMAKKAAREAVIQFQTEAEDPSQETIDNLDINKDIDFNSSQAPIPEDIFEDIGQRMTMRGDSVKYIIKRYGQYLTTVEHPYTWEQLKKDHGAGTYTVVLRSTLKNGFQGSESRTIAREEAKNQNQTSSEPNRQSNGQLSYMEYMALMQEKDDKARALAEEARRQAKEEAQAQMNQVTQMFQSMVAVMATQNQPKPDNSFELFKMQMEMQARTTEQMMNSQREMFKALSERMERLAEPKKETWDTATIMKMTEDARNSGMEMAQSLFELAEKKAEEKASLVEELREEIRAGISENNPKKSMSDSLIETILPTVAQALAQKGQQAPQQLTPQQLAMLQNRQQQVRLLQQRKQLALRNKKLAEQERLRREAAEQTPARDSENQHETSGEEVQSSEVPNVDENFGSLGAVHGETTVNEIPLMEAVPVERDEAIYHKCNEILPAFLGQMMLENVESHIAADKTLEFLNENGITRQIFLENIEAKDLTKVADDFALPQEAKIWLNELYGHISKNS